MDKLKVLTVAVLGAAGIGWLLVKRRQQEERRQQLRLEEKRQEAEFLKKKLTDCRIAQLRDEENIEELVFRLSSPEELTKYFDPIGHIPVQLVLVFNSQLPPKGPSDLETILLTEIGPLHAHIAIGNLILEWDSTSVIEPHGKPIQDRSIDGRAMQHDVREAELKPIEIALLKREVLEIVAQYNVKCKFHVIKCNSHDFVCQVLNNMYTPPPLKVQQTLPILQNRLKEYYKYLEKNKRDNIPDISTHSELNEYVKENIQNLSAIDKEYITVQYFIFHYKGGLLEGRRCEGQECLAEQVKAELDPKNMKIIKYRTRLHFHHSTLQDKHA